MQLINCDSRFLMGPAVTVVIGDHHYADFS